MAERILKILGALAVAALVTVLFRLALPPVNATTVGFAYLIGVLGVASAWGFTPSLAAALGATALYNFYFLPPVGSFTIADSQNWVALSAFLAAAVVASRLSALARARAVEAEARRRDATRLYELSRAILLASPEREKEDLERSLVTIFGWREARIETPEAAALAAGDYSQHWPLRIGGREVGALLLAGNAMSRAVGGRGGDAAAGAPRHDTAEAVAGMLAIALERARLRAETAHLQALRESDALKSALLDSFAHEMRTPLTAIKAAAGALLTQPAELAPVAAASEAERELAAVIVEEADRLNQHVEEMLEMARIEGGGLRAVPRAQPLEPLLRAALDSLRPPPGRVVVEAPQDSPFVVADGPLAARALTQLLANALAYSPPDRPVHLRARAEGGRARIEIRDAGPGIAPAARPHLFEKFFRAPEARRARPDGLGMGLAIARGLIVAQGGEIGAEWPPEGGTCFWISLPAGAAAASAATILCVPRGAPDAPRA